MLGRPVEREAEGSWKSLCLSPEHDDEPSPSMGVFYGRDGWKLNCWGCDYTGDLFDALQLLGPAESFPEAYAEACRLASEGLGPSTAQGEGPESFSRPPARRQGRPLNVQTVNRALCEAGRAENLVQRWLVGHKGLDVDPRWVVDAFDLGARRGALVLPYIAGDTEELVGAAFRWAPWGKHDRANFSGSRQASLGVFFGEARDRRRAQVILCEGESDCLAISAWLRDRAVDVLAIPGAGTKPTERAVARLAGRRVFLLLDADEEGEGARATWRASLLPPELNVRALDVYLPAELDAVDAGRSTVLRAIKKAVNG